MELGARVIDWSCSIQFRRPRDHTARKRALARCLAAGLRGGFLSGEAHFIAAFTALRAAAKTGRDTTNEYEDY